MPTDPKVQKAAATSTKRIGGNLTSRDYVFVSSRLGGATKLIRDIVADAKRAAKGKLGSTNVIDLGLCGKTVKFLKYTNLRAGSSKPSVLKRKVKVTSTGAVTVMDYTGKKDAPKLARRDAVIGKENPYSMPVPPKSKHSQLTRDVAKLAVSVLHDLGVADVKRKDDNLSFTTWTKKGLQVVSHIGFANGQEPDSIDVTVTQRIEDWSTPPTTVHFDTSFGAAQGVSETILDMSVSPPKSQKTAKVVKIAKPKKAKRAAAAPQPFFANPDAQKSAWDKVRKIFREERGRMEKRFAPLHEVGLRPDRSVHDSPRHFAATGRDGNGTVWVNAAPELGALLDSKVRGVLRHELGHAAVITGYEPVVAQRSKTLSTYDRIERQADRVAEKLSGAKIYYDKDDVEVSGPGARGVRPRRVGVR